ADADDLDACGLDLLEVGLQLDQLLLAVRSPAGRAVEHHSDLALLEELVEGPLLARLVLERKGRRLRADLQTGLLVGGLVRGPARTGVRQHQAKPDAQCKKRSHRNLLRLGKNIWATPGVFCNRRMPPRAIWLHRGLAMRQLPLLLVAALGPALAAPALADG